MKICIDFDDTICDNEKVLPGYRMGRPFPGAKDVITKLKDEGHSIVILSAKASNFSGIKAIKDWMKYFDIPYDDVTNIKPQKIDIIIDDKAIPFRGNWSSVEREIENVKES